MKTLQFPLARITISFVIGLLSFKVFESSITTLSLVSIGLIICLIFIRFFEKKSKTLNVYFGVLAIICSFFIGISTATIHKEIIQKNHYSRQRNNFNATHLVELSIREKLKSTLKNTRYIASIETLNHEKSFGKVILNLKKENSENIIPIGTHIILLAQIKKNKFPNNPNQFDYSGYIENQEIYAQIYTDESEVITSTYSNNIWNNFLNFRSEIIKNLESSNFKKEELNVLSALILGQKQDISPDILKDYQYAGAVHILSVSGLHVGFILMFITILLKPIPNYKKYKFLKLIIILSVLWSYGILAGLSPSIVRSVFMFSFIAIGLHLKRTVNIFHTLLVSMLIILIFKPSFLYEVGFQLSYVALFFILWLQPLLSSFWIPKNKFLKYFWDIFTVSFAAQIGTLPLSIYYFHQFPGLFFITNLIVIPGLSVLMIAGFITVIIACFGQVPEVIARITEIMIETINNIIHWIASFDCFVIRSISYSATMLLTSYIVIVFWILWLEKPIYKRLMISFLSVLLLQSVFVFEKYKSETIEELVVFNTRKSLITERKNNKISVFGNDSILKNTDNNIALQSYCVANYCDIREKHFLKNILYFKDKKILIIDSATVNVEKIHPDIIILVNSPKINLDRIVKQSKPQLIVADGSNYKIFVKLWNATCRKQNIPFHSTYEKGYFKL